MICAWDSGKKISQYCHCGAFLKASITSVTSIYKGSDSTVTDVFKRAIGIQTRETKSAWRSQDRICRGIVTVGFGLERLRRHSPDQNGKKGYLRREKWHYLISGLDRECEECLEKGVTGYEKRNETSVGSVREEKRQGSLENNGDREKLTVLNDISEIELAFLV